jgi:DNA helicase MCM8
LLPAGVHGNCRAQVDWTRDNVLHVNYDDLVGKSTIMDLPSLLREDSGQTLEAMGLGMCGVRAIAGFHRAAPSRLVVRVDSLQPVRMMRDVKADAIGECLPSRPPPWFDCWVLAGSFIALKGNVVRVGAIRPLVVAMDFFCPKCQQMLHVRFVHGKYDAPTRCFTKGCRSQRFEAQRESALTVDWQRIRIQEIETDILDAGRVPRSVEADLLDDLVDRCVPGDVVHISGVVRSMNVDIAAGRSAGSARELFLLYLEAHSIVAAKVSRSGQVDDKQFSERDLEFIRKVVEVPDPFSLLVGSLCPTIYGHETVKAALCLGLFGGTQSDATGDRFRLSVRGDPHILIVGDPGLGKSQMLRAASGLSPRGVYVCGNTASGSGLTVTMVRDVDSGDMGLEAGALVLSDQGICCIDEFDKMGKEHQSLLEAMEQQRISIAKAGMVASLSARTTVMAAANPVGGRYDRSKTVTENLKMSAALLSRFDLVFILLDKPDAERDRQLSAHVMMLHGRSGRAAEVSASQQSELFGGYKPSSRDIARTMAKKISAADERLARGQASQIQASLAASQARVGATAVGDSPVDEGKDIESRLRRGVLSLEEAQLLPANLMRKYIAYARRYCHPVLSPAAATVLQDFYIDLRRRHGDDETTPITTRQLESMVRLAQARAKIELRETVSCVDALDVVQLMKRSLLDIAMDEFGGVDFTRTIGTGSMSLQKQVRSLVAALSNLSRQRGSSSFTRDEIEEVVVGMKMQVPSLTDLIETMNQQSYLLKKGPRLYQLLVSSYG